MTGDSPEIGVRTGEVLAGKYRIDRVLGAGGMGVVVAAYHVQLDEKVAIKFLLPEALREPEAVARFSREAQAVVRIKSEHVARVFDVGHMQNGAPYMVMEYLEGDDLSVWLEKRGVLPIDQATEFLIQTCDALAEAHVLGIVHRDLKPANLFCTRGADGLTAIKVLDFGISKRALGAAEMSMTRTQALMGSPVYMSPEQLQSAKDVDSRTDIWSLGVILFELLSGRTPFEADQMPSLVLKIAMERPQPLRSLRPDLPIDLEYVILRCLEKDRAKRYTSVGELAVALAPFTQPRVRPLVERIERVLDQGGLASSAIPDAAGSRLSSPPRESTSGASAVQMPSLAPWGGTAHVKRSESKATTVILAGASLAAAVIVGLAAVAFWRTTPRAPAAATSSAYASEGVPLPAALRGLPGALPLPAASSIPASPAESVPAARQAATPSRPSLRAPAAPSARPAKAPSYEHM